MVQGFVTAQRALAAKNINVRFGVTGIGTLPEKMRDLARKLIRQADQTQGVLIQESLPVLPGLRIPVNLTGDFGRKMDGAVNVGLELKKGGKNFKDGSFTMYAQGVILGVALGGSVGKRATAEGTIKWDEVSATDISDSLVRGYSTMAGVKAEAGEIIQSAAALNLGAFNKLKLKALKPIVEGALKAFQKALEFLGRSA